MTRCSANKMPIISQAVPIKKLAGVSWEYATRNFYYVGTAFSALGSL